MKNNVTKTIILIALLQVPALFTATGATFETKIPTVDPLAATPVLTHFFPGLGYLLKETRDSATKYLPENKKALFNPIFSHVAQVREKRIRVDKRFLGNNVRDISANVFEEKAIRTIFKETAKDLGIAYKKVSLLQDKLLLANALMRFPQKVLFEDIKHWLYANRPQVLDENLNQIEPTTYFPYFVTRVETLKQSLAPYTNSEITLLLSLISAAAQSQIKSCQWYYLPELLKKLHKKVGTLSSLKTNKREQSVILNDIKDLKTKSDRANKFIIIHTDLLIPACEKIPLLKKLTKHKKASRDIAKGFLTTGAAALVALITFLDRSPWILGLNIVLAAIGGTVYGVHAATKPKVNIQPVTAPTTPRVTRQPITA
jgi:hypothetical protein